jgi:hypothetical protein
MNFTNHRINEIFSSIKECKIKNFHFNNKKIKKFN